MDLKQYVQGGGLAYERAASYNAKNQVTSDSVINARPDGTFVANTTYYYNASETSTGSGLWDGVTSGGTYNYGDSLLNPLIPGR